MFVPENGLDTKGIAVVVFGHFDQGEGAGILRVLFVSQNHPAEVSALVSEGFSCSKSHLPGLNGILGNSDFQLAGFVVKGRIELVNL